MQREHDSEHAHAIAAARAFKVGFAGTEQHFISLIEDALDPNASTPLYQGNTTQLNALWRRFHQCLDEMIDVNLQHIDPSREPCQEKLDEAVGRFLACLSSIRTMVPEGMVPTAADTFTYTHKMLASIEPCMRENDLRHTSKLDRMRFKTDREMAKDGGSWLSSMLVAHENSRDEKRDRAKDYLHAYRFSHGSVAWLELLPLAIEAKRKECAEKHLPDAPITRAETKFNTHLAALIDAAACGKPLEQPYADMEHSLFRIRNLLDTSVTETLPTPSQLHAQRAAVIEGLQAEMAKSPPSNKSSGGAGYFPGGRR